MSTSSVGFDVECHRCRKLFEKYFFVEMLHFDAFRYAMELSLSL